MCNFNSMKKYETKNYIENNAFTKKQFNRVTSVNNNHV